MSLTLLPFLILIATTCSLSVIDYYPHNCSIYSYDDAFTILKYNLHSLSSLISSSSSDVILLPEYGLTGPVIANIDQARWFSTNLELTCPAFTLIKEIYSGFNKTIIFNLPIRFNTTGPVYNGAVALNCSLEITVKAIYLKENLYGNEVKYFTRGNSKFNDLNSCFKQKESTYCLAICFDLMFSNVYKRPASVILAPVAWVNFAPFITASSTFLGLSQSHNTTIATASISGLESTGSVIASNGNSLCQLNIPERNEGHGKLCEESDLLSRNGNIIAGKVLTSNPTPFPRNGLAVQRSGTYVVSSGSVKCVFDIENRNVESLYLVASDGHYNGLRAYICTLLPCFNQDERCFQETSLASNVNVELTMTTLSLNTSHVPIPLYSSFLQGLSLAFLKVNHGTYNIKSKPGDVFSSFGIMLNVV
ncbi:hypothetical protein P9112_007833 [Eukaryota sp. TZLM1-RC]